MKHYGLCLSLLCAGLSLSAVENPAYAQADMGTQESAATQPEPGKATLIREIKIEGVQRIEPDTVRSYLVVAKGERATSAKLNESLKSLYNTGFFANATMRLAKDGVLTVTVKENPVINRLVFEGNNAISTKDLEKEVQLKVRQVYSKTKVKNDVQRILDVYRRSGRLAALVEPKIITLEQNRVDLVFEITEGERTGVRRVHFVGNTHFDEDTLRTALATKETAWWRFFSSTDFYDPDRLNYDKDLLRRFYLNQGYIDFRVLNAHAELTPDRKDFFITFTVEEGEPYKLGKIELTTSLKNVDLEALRKRITIKSGDYYSVEKVEKSIAQITSSIADLQYGFAQVQPKLNQDHEKHVIDINFVINQGPRVFVQRININGNTRTLDRVIRRQMKLTEGDPYVLSNVKKSEQAIRDLGFFDDVKVTTAEGTQPDQSVLNVEVKDKPTGEISVGAGYSSTDGALADFSIREKNLLGKGQDLRFGVQASQKTQNYDISFTEPYFLERDLAAGSDLFRVTSNDQTYSSYNEARNGIDFRLGYPLSESLRQKLTYGLTQTSITNIASTASRFIQDQAGTTLTSSVSSELLYDKRDSKLNPTEGYYIKLNDDVAGLGGDAHYLRTRLASTYYIPVHDKWVLSLGGEVGYIFGFGEDVRIEDRFFLGGDTLRGFKFAGVGPRDLTNGNNDALGGNRLARTRVELTFPLGLPEEFGIRGRVFDDAGLLDESQEHPLPTDNFRNDHAIRMGAGAGLTWQSPFGPIGVDLAQAVLKQSYDQTEIFRFSFGTHF